MTPPQLAFLFEAQVHVAAPIEMGPGPNGAHRVIPITGGIVTGPHVNGIVLPGGSAPGSSPLDLIRYYKQIPHDFSRLFLSPGMCHCQGGPGLDDFDSLIALQRWVENNEAPERLIAAGRAFPGRTRPLCAYPKTAKYNGKGAPESAASFTCALP